MVDHKVIEMYTIPSDQSGVIIRRFGVDTDKLIGYTEYIEERTEVNESLTDS